jgi:RNA polymerase sigma factor (TIGR02999 family)
MTDVTRLLRAIEDGDQSAINALFPVVYDELKHLASRKIASEKPGQTLCPSGLVHEAYLKLVDSDGQLSFQNRRHFFGAAARAMRHILVDAARRRGRAKRGAGLQRIELLDAAAKEPDAILLALDEAVTDLAARDPVAAEIVDLHHFAELSYDQTADLLGLTVYEVRQKWAFARAWLIDCLK